MEKQRRITQDEKKYESPEDAQLHIKISRQDCPPSLIGKYFHHSSPDRSICAGLKMTNKIDAFNIYRNSRSIS